MSTPHRAVLAFLAAILLLTGCDGTGAPPTERTPPTLPQPAPTITMQPSLDCAAPYGVPVVMTAHSFPALVSLLGMTVCTTPEREAVMIGNDTGDVWVLSQPEARWSDVLLDADWEEGLYQTTSQEMIPGIPIRDGTTLYMNIPPDEIGLNIDLAAEAALEEYDAWIATTKDQGIDLVSEFANATDSPLVKVVGGCMKVTYGVVEQAITDDPEGQDLDALLEALNVGYGLTTSAAECSGAYEDFRASRTRAAQIVTLEAVEARLRVPAVTAPLADDLLRDVNFARLVRLAPRL